MKSLRLLFILGALSSVRLISAQYTLTLNLQGMDAYIGDRIEVRVTEQPSDREVGRKVIPSLESGSATVLMYVFLQGRNYNVDFYADVNGNGHYDAPPEDHAWRRIIVNAGGDILIDFMPLEDYFDIELPDAFPYSQYNAVWGGKWMNQTFGSTDSIMAGLQLRCDSVFGHFMTKGVFGNPAPVTFDYAEARPASGIDTIHYMVPAPWNGEVTVINGDVSGDINLAGTGLQFTGTLGETQMLCLYTVVVAGNPFANGYFYVRELNILDSAPPLDLSTVSLNPTCNGVCDGYVDLMVSGGTPGYTYSWSNGLTTEDYANACVGNGGVTVTDADGCAATTSFMLSDPESITIDLYILNPTCAGSCDGEVEIDVAGGMPPYSFQFSGGSQGNFCAGEYVLTVTDAHSCMATDTFLLFDPASILLDTVLVTQPSGGQNNGSITVMASGGFPPLTYSLDGGPYQNSNIFNELPPGVFEICVQDGRGCIICSDSIVLQEMVGVQDLDYSFSFFPNPVTSELHINGDIPLSVELLDVQGQTILKEQDQTKHELLIADLPDGIYILKISDGDKCAFRKIVKIKG